MLFFRYKNPAVSVYSVCSSITLARRNVGEFQFAERIFRGMRVLPVPYDAIFGDHVHIIANPPLESNARVSRGQWAVGRTGNGSFFQKIVPTYLSAAAASTNHISRTNSRNDDFGKKKNCEQLANDVEESPIAPLRPLTQGRWILHKHARACILRVPCTRCIHVLLILY